MFDTGLVADAASFAALAARLVAGFDAAIPGPAAAEALTEVLAAVRLGELLTCRLIERVDRTGQFAADGSASTVAYLRGISGERSSWASRRVTIGRALADSLPETGAMWGDGKLGLDHACVIAQLTKDLDEELTADIDGVLAAAAEHCTPAELNSLGESIKAQAAPDEATADADAKRRSQTLSFSQTIDGRWRLDGWLDSEAGMHIAAALKSFTRKAALDADGGLDPIGLRRAEALVRIAAMATAHAETCNGEPGARHTTIVTIPLADLTSGLGTGTIEGGGTITAAAARRLACDGHLIPAVLGADSEIVDFGRTRRLVSPGQHRLLAQRDGGCLFPGCDRPTADCQAHHRRHWTAQGGDTDESNLDLFCSYHHHLHHEGGWTYRIVDPITLAFTPPGGGTTRYSKRRTPARPPRKMRT